MATCTVAHANLRLQERLIFGFLNSVIASKSLFISAYPYSENVHVRAACQNQSTKPCVAHLSSPAKIWRSEDFSAN